MKIKQIPQDFIVNEIYELNQFKEKEENTKLPYYYFLLTKIDYNQIKALEIIAKNFNTSTKLIHIAGTKDKTGVTTQVISVYGIKEENFVANLKYFNDNHQDLKLEFLNKFNGRINLGDNLGNKFEITIRDLTENQIPQIKQNIENIKQNGVLNYFDDQRFGYANNSHIIGKYIIKKEIEKALYEILTSLPPQPKEELKQYVEKIKENFKKIKNQDKTALDEILQLQPKFLSEQKEMLEHLIKYKNDFSGSFRLLHKKLRTLYINAYQSYIFNETIKELNTQNLLQNYDEISLLDSTLNYDEPVKKITLKLIEKDNITIEDLKLKSMPELKIFSVKRKTKNYPKNIQIKENKLVDELNENKLKITITFELEKGEYATNVIKQLTN